MSEITLSEYEVIASNLPEPKKYPHDFIEVLLTLELEFCEPYTGNINCNEMCVNPKKVVFKKLRLSNNVYKWQWYK